MYNIYIHTLTHSLTHSHTNIPNILNSSCTFWYANESWLLESLYVQHTHTYIEWKRKGITMSQCNQKLPFRPLIWRNNIKGRLSKEEDYHNHIRKSQSGSVTLSTQAFQCQPPRVLLVSGLMRSLIGPLHQPRRQTGFSLYSCITSAKYLVRKSGSLKRIQRKRRIIILYILYI